MPAASSFGFSFRNALSGTSSVPFGVAIRHAPRAILREPERQQYVFADREIRDQVEHLEHESHMFAAEPVAFRG